MFSLVARFSKSIILSNTPIASPIAPQIASLITSPIKKIPLFENTDFANSNDDDNKNNDNNKNNENNENYIIIGPVFATTFIITTGLIAFMFGKQYGVEKEQSKNIRLVFDLRDSERLVSDYRKCLNDTSNNNIKYERECRNCQEILDELERVINRKRQ